MTLIGRLFRRTKDIQGTANFFDSVPISLAALKSRQIIPNAPINGGGDLSGDVPIGVDYAEDNAPGVIQIATDDDISTGINNTRAVPPGRFRTYVDSLTQVLDHKDAVRVATTANITLSGLQTVDTVALNDGDPVLVHNQSTGSQNGKWIARAGSWERAKDADTSAKVTTGMEVRVNEGTTYGGSKFYLATTGAIILGTTTLTFLEAASGGGGGGGEPFADSGTAGIMKVFPDPADPFDPGAVGINDPSFLSIGQKAHFSDRFTDYVVSGISPTVPGGTLTMTIPSGAAYANGRRMTPSAVSKTFTASRDTYVDLVDTGAYNYVEVTNGSGEPGLTANSVRVLKVVSDGTQVVSSELRSRFATAKRCKVGLAAVQSIPNFVSAVSDVAFTQELADPSNWHSNVTNPTRVTPGEAGIYLAEACMEWAASTVGVRIIMLSINGVSQDNGIRVTTSAPSSTNATGLRERVQILTLNAGDYVGLQVAQTSGGPLNLATSTYLNLIKLF